MWFDVNSCQYAVIFFCWHYQSFARKHLIYNVCRKRKINSLCTLSTHIIYLQQWTILHHLRCNVFVSCYFYFLFSVVHFLAHGLVFVVRSECADWNWDSLQCHYYILLTDLTIWMRNVLCVALRANGMNAKLAERVSQESLTQIFYFW